jgi:orotidine-5'-phosphate decarboxylase
VTPEGAATAGARYVVLGRTVTAAPDPVAAMAAARAALAHRGAAEHGGLHDGPKPI